MFTNEHDDVVFNIFPQTVQIPNIDIHDTNTRTKQLYKRCLEQNQNIDRTVDLVCDKKNAYPFFNRTIYCVASVVSMETTYTRGLGAGYLAFCFFLSSTYAFFFFFFFKLKGFYENGSFGS